MSDITGNSELAREKGRRGGKAGKGSKAHKTIIKEALGLDKTNLILSKIERNINKFIDSKDPKIALDATKAFTEYYKPKRSTAEVNLKTKVTVVFENIKKETE
jgi:hypothetical protein